MNEAAICGNCGKPYSAHYHEQHGKGLEHFCFTNTNGDLFTDTPSDETLFSMAIEQDVGLYDRLLDQWRAANGHAPNNKDDAGL